MKMKLTLVLLLFLGVGALARSPARTSEEMEEVANELNERYARSAPGESSEVATGGTGTLSGMYAILKPLATMLGLSKVSHIPALVAKYYSGNLPVLLESLLKSVGITTSLQEMQDPSGLYQTMKSIPIVGTMVKFMTDTLLIPINIIAIIFTLGTTIMQHIYNSIPNIL